MNLHNCDNNMRSFQEIFEEEKRLIHNGSEIDIVRTFQGNMQCFRESLSFKRQALGIDGPNPPPLEASPVFTQDELWDAISKISGREADCSYVITGMLCHDFKSYLGLGTTTESHIAWRLEPDQDFLTVTQPAPTEERDIDDMLCESLLGVNLHVQLPVSSSFDGSLQGDKVDESAQEQASSEEDGFVFLQLGRLQYYMPEPGEEVTTANAGSKDWTKTHFGVVVKFENSGRAGSV